MVSSRVVLFLAAALGFAPGAASQTPGSRQPGAEGADPYVHEVWTVQDGLPVNAILHVLHGRNGYLWLATWDGLVRFDGVRFTVFSTGNSDGLPSNRIVDLIEGAEGSLWLRTEQNHLVRFREGEFTHFGAAHDLRDRSTRVAVRKRSDCRPGTPAVTPNCRRTIPRRPALRQSGGREFRSGSCSDVPGRIRLRVYPSSSYRCYPGGPSCPHFGL